jgi:hypothetical protein
MKKIHIKKEIKIIKDGGYFPVLVRDKNRLYLFCRCNGGHYGKNGNITLLTSLDGLKWENQGVVAFSGTDTRNPACYSSDNGDLYLATFKFDTYYGENGRAIPNDPTVTDLFDVLFYKGNIESGLNQLDIDVKKFFNGNPFSPYGQIIKYNDSLIMGVYNGKGYASFLQSYNNGDSWDRYVHISKGYREPAIAIANDGKRLIAAVRGDPLEVGTDGTYISYSLDETLEKWSKPFLLTESEIHPATITRLNDQVLMMVVAKRTLNSQMLLIYTTKDDFRSFNGPFRLSSVYKNCDFGYPSTVVLDNDSIITIFYKKQYPNSSYFEKNKQIEHYSGKGAFAIGLIYSIKSILDKDI